MKWFLFAILVSFHADGTQDTFVFTDPYSIPSPRMFRICLPKIVLSIPFTIDSEYGQHVKVNKMMCLREDTLKKVLGTTFEPKTEI